MRTKSIKFVRIARNTVQVAFIIQLLKDRNVEDAQMAVN